MKVTEIMTSVVQSLEPRDPVKNAAVIMCENDIGSVLVCDDSRVRGILTDRDIVIRALAKSSDLSDVTVGEIMSTKPVCCAEDDTIKQAATIMETHQIRRLPVLDREGKLTGIVSLGDIATHVDNDHLSADLIEGLSRHEHVFLTRSG